MKKYSWLFVIFGVAALSMALMFAVAFGAGVTYFLLQADPVQAAFEAPMEVDDSEGVLISGVNPDSAAAKTGLVRGDIILEINGDPVNNVIEMKTVLVELKPGTQVELTVLHGDETRMLDVELDDIKGFASLGVGTCEFPTGGKMFPEGSMGEVLVEGFPMGAEIVEVIPGSPAEKAGLQIGDLILSVDEKPIGSKSDLAVLVQKYAPGETVNLKIQSPETEEPHTVEVTLGAHPDKPAQPYLGVAYQSGAPMGFEGGKFPFMDMLPFDKMPEGFDSQEGMPHYFFHHGGEFDGELPEGSEEGGEFYFHGMPSLPEGIESAVIISEVLVDTPAADAGVQPGDLIIAIDGESVTEIESFVEILQSRKPGDDVSITIIRGAAEIELGVTLTQNPDDSTKGFLGVLAGTFRMMENMQLPEGFDQNFEFDLPGLPGGDS